MARWITFLFCLGLAACGSKKGKSDQPAKVPVGADAGATASAAPDAGPAAAPPAAKSWTIEKGDRLDAIADETYGSRHYSQLIAAVNKVKPEKLSIGTVLDLPTLAEVVRGAVTGEEAERIAAGIDGWSAAREAAWEARRDDKPIAAAVQTQIKQAATDLSAGAAALPKGAAATAFVRAADAMDTVAAGATPANGYDVDAVDRRIAEGLTKLAAR